MRAGNCNTVGIGLTDNEQHSDAGASEGVWQWTDHSPLDYGDPSNPSPPWAPGQPDNGVTYKPGAAGEDAVALTFVQGYTNANGEYDGRWNDIHNMGYNRKTGCDSCAQNEEAVWGSYPMCARYPHETFNLCLDHLI